MIYIQVEVALFIGMFKSLLSPMNVIDVSFKDHPGLGDKLLIPGRDPGEDCKLLQSPYT